MLGWWEQLSMSTFPVGSGIQPCSAEHLGWAWWHQTGLWRAQSPLMSLLCHCGVTGTNRHWALGFLFCKTQAPSSPPTETFRLGRHCETLGRSQSRRKILLSIQRKKKVFNFCGSLISVQKVEHGNHQGSNGPYETSQSQGACGSGYSMNLFLRVEGDHSICLLWFLSVVAPSFFFLIILSSSAALPRSSWDNFTDGWIQDFLQGMINIIPEYPQLEGPAQDTPGVPPTIRGEQ